MVKLVFVDMDGTFLDSSKAITPENLAALDAAHELGVQFVPCTGRNVNGVPRQLVEHPCVRYAICANGAVVSEAKTGRVLHEINVSKQLILSLYEKVGHLPITFDLFADDTVYTERSRFGYIDRLPLQKATREFVKGTRTVYEESFEERLAAMGEVCRLNVFYQTPEDRDRVWREVDAEPSLRRSSSLPCNIEITDVSAHKGAGLGWLCEYLGVSPSDCVAFGDGNNDLTMLEAAGDGVAMANAEPSVLAVADHVALSCDESGVSRYLAPIFHAMRR